MVSFVIHASLHSHIHVCAVLCTRLCSSIYTPVQLYVHCSYVLRVYDWILTLYSVLPAKYTTGILLYNPLCRYTVLADVACSVCASQDMYFSQFAVAACTAGMVSARLWSAMSRCSHYVPTDSDMRAAPGSDDTPRRRLQNSGCGSLSCRVLLGRRLGFVYFGVHS